jgi:DNA-binding transcriptional ArsR family regulator
MLTSIGFPGKVLAFLANAHGGATVVYRIHFTAQDLARIRIADEPRPLLETNMAMRLLQERNQPVRFDAWRHRVLTRLSRPARLLFGLVPPRGYTPMFLVPNESGGVAQQLDLVRGTHSSTISTEMTHFAERHAPPGWARGLDRSAMQCLADLLGQFHAVAVAPYWPQISALFTADRTARGREFLDGGIDRLLVSLHPTGVRWRPPVLEILTVSRLSGELHLHGRGLLLVPTVFGAEAPTIDTAGPQPCLTYPARHRGQIIAAASADDVTSHDVPPAHLVALLGRTRAAVLHTIAGHPGCTTTELAAAARISPSSASEHATVLRTAGLITTLRHHQAVLHTLTPAGDSLLPVHGPGLHLTGSPGAG